jgi:hypothetical protein
MSYVRATDVTMERDAVEEPWAFLPKFARVGGMENIISELLTA